jgi:hypothetical protein
MAATQIPFGAVPPRVETELLRRLDWRVLLPMPELKRVGYCSAQKQTALLRALRAYAGDIHLLNDRHADLNCDLVVAESPTLRQLSLAARNVKAGGCIYVEMSQLPLVRPVGAFQNRLRCLGFRSIRVHWHFPSFERRQQMIPFDSPAVAQLCATEKPHLAWFTHLPVRYRIWQRFVRHVSLLAVR